MFLFFPSVFYGWNGYDLPNHPISLNAPIHITSLNLSHELQNTFLIHFQNSALVNLKSPSSLSYSIPLCWASLAWLIRSLYPNHTYKFWSYLHQLFLPHLLHTGTQQVLTILFIATPSALDCSIYFCFTLD